MEKPTKDFSRFRKSDTVDLYFKWSVIFLVLILTFAPLISAWGVI